MPPEQVEPVDLSVKTSLEAHIPDDLREEAMRAGLLGPNMEITPKGVVLKVPHFQSLALQTLGLDLTLRTGEKKKLKIDLREEALRTGDKNWKKIT